MLGAYCRRHTTTYHVIYHPATSRVVVTSYPGISNSHCRIVVEPINIVDCLRNLRRHIQHAPIVFFDVYYTLTPLMWYHFVDSVAPDESSEGDGLATPVSAGDDL